MNRLSGLLGQWLLASALLGVIYVLLHFVLGWSNTFLLGLVIVVGAPTSCVFIARALPTLGKVAGSALFLYAVYFYASTPLAGNTGVERGLERTFLIVYTLGYFALGVVLRRSVLQRLR